MIVLLDNCVKDSEKKTLQKAFTSDPLKDETLTGYGYGWFLKTSNGIKFIEHEGGMPGYVTNEIYFPAEDILLQFFVTAEPRQWMNYPSKFQA